MNSLSDQMKEFENDAVKALDNFDFARAYCSTVKAAEIGILLANRTTGRVSESYIQNANSLLNAAENIQKYIPNPNSDSNVENKDSSKLKKEINSNSETETDTNNDWLILDKPNVKLDDVAGLKDVKAALMQDVITPMRNPKLAKKLGIAPGGGFLLFGPPGNGKTFIAQAIAGELDAPFFNVTASQIKSKYVGETQKNMQRLFDEANKYPLSVIFIDETDELLKKRSAGDNGSAVAQFLQHADGLKKHNPLVLLGGTNNPWDLDPAVLRPGRFDRRIYVGLPDEETRLAIFKLNLKNIKIPLDPQIENGLEEFAKNTAGYSCADIKFICVSAKKKALRRLVKKREEEWLLSYEDLNESCKSTRSSVTESQVKKYLEWENKPPQLAKDPDNFEND